MTTEQTVEMQLLDYAARQTKAQESLLKIATIGVWVIAFALFIGLVVAYVLAVG